MNEGSIERRIENTTEVFDVGEKLDREEGRLFDEFDKNPSPGKKRKLLLALMGGLFAMSAFAGGARAEEAGEEKKPKIEDTIIPRTAEETAAYKTKLVEYARAEAEKSAMAEHEKIVTAKTETVRPRITTDRATSQTERVEAIKKHPELDGLLASVEAATKELLGK